MAARDRGQIPETNERRARIRADLERLGVVGAACDELTRRLEALAPRLSPDSYEGALAGVALAHGLQRQTDQQIRRNVRDMREIERMLGAFSEELGKLDETIRLLAAYLERMREKTSPAPVPRVVH
jgi:hypothetical protein